jgi:hypothetical protein
MHSQAIELHLKGLSLEEDGQLSEGTPYYQCCYATVHMVLSLARALPFCRPVSLTCLSLFCLSVSLASDHVLSPRHEAGARH